MPKSIFTTSLVRGTARSAVAIEEICLPGQVALPIAHIHTYLVYPAKGVTACVPIGGSSLKLSGKLYNLLKGTYDRSEVECDIAISFNESVSGKQENPCRDLIKKYVGKPTPASGRSIATRLGKHTDNRSKLGLLFLIVGKEKQEHKIVISRFPADSGILAEQEGGSLNVEFLERIFMKSAKAYKAVMYRHSSIASGFWKGFAVDKQMDDPGSNASRYWINDFLDSNFLTTGAIGTRRLAVACRNAARKTDDLEVKNNIIAAVTLAKGQKGRNISARDFVDRMGLSAGARDAIVSEIKPHLLDEKFVFDSQEFGDQIAYRSVELDNGGILTAETEDFDNVFKTQVISKTQERVKFTTEGKIVSQKLRKAAP